MWFQCQEALSPEGAWNGGSGPPGGGEVAALGHVYGFRDVQFMKMVELQCMSEMGRYWLILRHARAI